MPTFILSLNWTEQGIRSVKESPKRAQAARDLGKKLGVEIKQVFLTSGESDLSHRGRSGRRQHCEVRAYARLAGQCAHPHRACLVTELP